MDGLADHITEEFGERCPEYAEGCINCTIWTAYDKLVEAGALSDDEVSMAVHWMDRYAAGIDGYPQFDRIIARRAAE